MTSADMFNILLLSCTEKLDRNCWSNDGRGRGSHLCGTLWIIFLNPVVLYFVLYYFVHLFLFIKNLWLCLITTDVCFPGPFHGKSGQISFTWLSILLIDLMSSIPVHCTKSSLGRGPSSRIWGHRGPSWVRSGARVGRLGVGQEASRAGDQASRDEVTSRVGGWGTWGVRVRGSWRGGRQLPGCGHVRVRHGQWGKGIGHGHRHQGLGEGGGIMVRVRPRVERAVRRQACFQGLTFLLVYSFLISHCSYPKH